MSDNSGAMFLIVSNKFIESPPLYGLILSQANTFCPASGKKITPTRTFINYIISHVFYKINYIKDLFIQILDKLKGDGLNSSFQFSKSFSQC